MMPTATPAPRPAGAVRLLDRAGGEESRQVARYVAVGVWNAVFGIALFAGLTTDSGSWMPYLVALLITYVVTVVVAFALYRTSSGSGTYRRRLPTFRGRVPFRAALQRCSCSRCWWKSSTSR